VSPVKYKLGFYIPEDDILHSHSLENLKSYRVQSVLTMLCSTQDHRVSGLRLSSGTRGSTVS
jgi:hypothetical protein